MKIAMLVKNFATTGGAERYAVELSTRLLKRGHEVHVFAQRWDASLTAEFILHPIRWLRFSRYVNALYYAIRARRLVTQRSFDIVHSHQRTLHHHLLSMHHPCYRSGRPSSGRWGRALNAIFAALNPRHLAYRWLERHQFTCGPLTHVIAVSQETKLDILAHYRLERARVCVIYPGVDSERLTPEKAPYYRADVRKELGLADYDQVVIFVGTDFERKGLRYAIEAIAILHRDDRRRVTPRLLVLGAGDSRPYRRQAEQSGIAARVHFLGLRTQVERYYAAADMCLLPSLSDPFGMVALEAMACGLPVIVSRRQGVAELLKDGYNAYLLENPRDSTRIAELIAQLDDDRLREEMGRRARETAQACSWDAMTDRILALYAESVRQRREAGGT
jgi:UDP-glucose:(heptosyl)LPS alpha-1,3-glucosyltransferase